MTTELFWLVLSAILTSALWIPYIVGVSTTPRHRVCIPEWLA